VARVIELAPGREGGDSGLFLRLIGVACLVRDVDDAVVQERRSDDVERHLIGELVEQPQPATYNDRADAQRELVEKALAEQ
jgi:hypothetical protein